MLDYITKLAKYTYENDWITPISCTVSIMSVIFVCVLCFAGHADAYVKISLVPVLTGITLISGLIFIRELKRM